MKAKTTSEAMNDFLICMRFLSKLDLNRG